MKAPSSPIPYLRASNTILGLLVILGVYLAVSTIIFTERLHHLQSQIHDKEEALASKSRELYVKDLLLKDVETRLHEQSSTIEGVEGQLRHAVQAASRAHESTAAENQDNAGIPPPPPPAANANVQVTGRPRLVLNIGPMKTGSTTLQTYGHTDRRLLRKDGYAWPTDIWALTYGTRPISVDCFLHHEERTEKECGPLRPETMSHIKTFLEQNKSLHAYFVDEMFGVVPDRPSSWEQLKFLNDYHDVHMSVTYRRYFEWWVSFYVQAFKYNQEEEGMTNKWPAPLEESKGMRYNNRVKPIGEYFDLLQTDETSIFVRRWGVKHGEMHPAEAQRRRFEPHFPNVQIFNFHSEPDNLVSNFYCNMLPGARSSCEGRRRVGTKRHMNAAESHHYDMLAVAAFDLGLIETSHEGNTRKNVANAARVRQERLLHLSATDFPLVCMTQEQIDMLWNMSLKFEIEMVPEWGSTRTAEHRAAFDKYVEKKNFCTIDAEKAIQDEQWQAFFKTLRLKPPPEKKTPVQGVERRKRIREEAKRQMENAKAEAHAAAPLAKPVQQAHGGFLRPIVKGWKKAW